MIKLDAVSKRYPGSNLPALDNLTLTIPEGITVALIGPSGCGKTTTMRLINRLEEPTSGAVWLAGDNIAKLDPVTLRRHIGYVIQQVGLFPHLSVAENIATVPRLLGWSSARIAQRVGELLELVGLDADKDGQRYPASLSGGQRQRVGVARALAADPPVLLMDEPFGAIDPLVRGRLQQEIRQILMRVKKTVVIVTHDMDEAIKMGDRVAIMREGRLCQYDTPATVLSAPASEFVAAFIGNDSALKLLALTPARQWMQPATQAESNTRLRDDATLKDALVSMLDSDAQIVTFHDAQGVISGELSREQLFSFHQRLQDGAHALS
ncbi:ABC transporter ATP-binding protein [Paramixta manurensis]|uniref:ABC transporter ATP-binding protein n=1 Tax=Paramixta manurensis TaxID=2740817 RepID=A0A6M8UBJ5_9GAMM|nr:ABC transporter ATP-binding protein [Erwiniaceae bacterium PD-1]